MLNAWSIWKLPLPSTQHLNMSREIAEDGGGRNGVPDMDSKGEEGVAECACVCACVHVCVRVISRLYRYDSSVSVTLVYFVIFKCC